MRCSLSVSVAAVSLFACGTTRVDEPGAREQPPIALALGLSSYSSPEEVQATFGGITGAVRERSGGPVNERCPRFEARAVSFPDRVDRDHTGELLASFVNEKVYLVRFFPDDFDSYVARLERDGVVFQDPTLAEHHVNPWITKGTHEGRGYVSWVDTRLEQEVLDWIRACA